VAAARPRGQHSALKTHASHTAGRIPTVPRRMTGSLAPADGSTATNTLRALQQRVEDLSQELSAQLSSAVASLQEEVLRMMGDQQEELQKLRLQQHCLQDHLAARQRPQHVDSGDAASGGTTNCLDKGATNSLELQLQDLVNELRKLQKEQQLHLHQEVPEASRSPSAGRNRLPQAADASAGDVSSILKELRDECSIVADMLDNVKKEKCEVIAMMHTFATSKAEAMEELEGLRLAACDEISAATIMVRKAVGRGGHSEVPPNVRVSREQTMREEREEVLLPSTHSLHGRQGSRTSLCPSAMQGVAAAPVASVPGQPLPAPCGSAQQQGQTWVLTSSSVVQQADPLTRTAAHAGGGRDHRRHSTGTVAVDAGIRRVCSPARQYSAGGTGALLPVSVACSPPMLPRPTIVAADPQKSPVRRFVSAGSALGGSISTSWAAVSQGMLIR